MIESVPDDLLDSPLDYVFAQNFRMRCFCNRLRELASVGRVARTEAHTIVSFLAHDVAIHHEDERDLLPAVLQSALPEDGLEPVISLLGRSEEHSVDRVPAIMRAFIRQRSRPVTTLTRATSELVVNYATAAQRHIALVNGIVLVIARKRLKPHDLDLISNRMKWRRGATL